MGHGHDHVESGGEYRALRGVALPAPGIGPLERARSGPKQTAEAQQERRGKQGGPVFIAEQTRLLSFDLEGTGQHRQDQRGQEQPAQEHPSSTRCAQKPGDPHLRARGKRTEGEHHKSGRRVDGHRRDVLAHEAALQPRGAEQVADQGHERHDQDRQRGDLMRIYGAPPSVEQQQRRARDGEADGRVEAHSSGARRCGRGRRVVEQQLVDREVPAEHILGQGEQTDQGHQHRQRSRHSGRSADLEQHQGCPGQHECEGGIGLHLRKVRIDASERRALHCPADQDSHTDERNEDARNQPQNPVRECRSRRAGHSDVDGSPSRVSNRDTADLTARNRRRRLYGLGSTGGGAYAGRRRSAHGARRAWPLRPTARECVGDGPRSEGVSRFV